MTNKEGYNYEEFLSDSSDDYPKYDEDIKQKHFVIKQADDDMNYQQAYSQTEIHIALENVLELAGERLEQLSSTANEIESVQIVKDYFFNSGQSVTINSKIAKNDKDN